MKSDLPAGPVTPPPTDLPPADLDVDEGPMRSELLRQIAGLEEELAVRLATARDWHRRRITPRRGPALLPTAALEQIRDELLRALHDLAHGTTKPQA